MFFVFGTWSSWARDLIQAAFEMYGAAIAMPGPLTYCTGPGIEPASWFFRGANDFIVPEWELLLCFVSEVTLVFKVVFFPVYYHICFFFFFFLPFLGWCMEVPRPRVESELQPPAYATARATPGP